jgi:hypothetical protein
MIEAFTPTLQYNGIFSGHQSCPCWVCVWHFRDCPCLRHQKLMWWQSKARYDWLSARQFIWSPIWSSWPDFSPCLESYIFVFVGYPLWWQDGCVRVIIYGQIYTFIIFTILHVYITYTRSVSGVFPQRSRLSQAGPRGERWAESDGQSCRVPSHRCINISCGHNIRHIHPWWWRRRQSVKRQNQMHIDSADRQSRFHWT